MTWPEEAAPQPGKQPSRPTHHIRGHHCLASISALGNGTCWAAKGLCAGGRTAGVARLPQGAPAFLDEPLNSQGSLQVERAHQLAGGPRVLLAGCLGRLLGRVCAHTQKRRCRSGLCGWRKAAGSRSRARRNGPRKRHTRGAQRAHSNEHGRRGESGMRRAGTE